MKEWITKDGMPCPCPGMLIHTAGSGLWFQVTSCDVDGSNLCGHYLQLTEDGDGVVIIDSLIKGFKPTVDSVSELYIYEREHGVPRRDIINIMKKTRIWSARESMFGGNVYV